jgi:hypothetical protein
MVARPKRKTAKKARRKTSPKKSAPKAILPPTGPVTLDQARAMTVAKQPSLAIRKAAAPAATPAPLGAERKRLQLARESEFDRRIREYKSTMEIMKKRGARPPSSKAKAKAGAKGKGKGEGGAAAGIAKGAGFQPLQIFAEGDSWFDYPVPFFGGGIIPRLEDLLGVPILNLAKAGDEVRYMLGVEERKLLIKHLTKGCPAGGPWDAMLFSGGGNDIVDNPMALWVGDWNPANPPQAHINQPRFSAALALVMAGYEDVIALRDALSPSTQLIFHGYDLAIPDGRGICFLGPWLKPTFDLRKFPDRAAAQAVVTAMLQQFAAMLQTLAAKPKVTVVNTQGTLAQNPSSWHNELHPSSKGFDKITAKIRDRIAALFPTRVV